MYLTPDKMNYYYYYYIQIDHDLELKSQSTQGRSLQIGSESIEKGMKANKETIPFAFLHSWLSHDRFAEKKSQMSKMLDIRN